MMKAMILAAGKGERMRPLTDTTPKPLLEIASKPLIAYQLEALIKAGVDDVVINLGHLGKQIRDYLGDGNDCGIQIQYSDEGDELLETAGGIIQALPLLGDAPFIVTNADIYTAFDYASLPKKLNADAHLVLVNNPPHNPEGDFALLNGKVVATGSHKLTYSGIAIYHPRLFLGLESGKRPLAPLLLQAARGNRVNGELYCGEWCDIGTVERLNSINEKLA